MNAFRTSVEVPVGAAAAYRFIAENYAANHARWDAGIQRVDLPGPVVPGARGSEVRRFLGRKSASRFEVLAAEPPRRFVLRDEPAIWALTRSYTIDALGPGASRVALDFDMRPRALGFRLAFPLVGRLIRRQVRATVRQMGEVLTQACGPSSPGPGSSTRHGTAP
jgi:hypothetical protein